jgi:hypothetical protein
VNVGREFYGSRHFSNRALNNARACKSIFSHVANQNRILGSDRRQDVAKYSARRSKFCIQPSSIPSRYGAAPAGTYYVIVVDDSGGAVVESAEGNNTKYTSTTITVP